jgi:hypothetical protein
MNDINQTKRWDTRWLNVMLEFDWMPHLEQSNVVVVIFRVVILMQIDLAHFCDDVVSVIFDKLIVIAHYDSYVCRLTVENNGDKNNY